MNPECPNCKSYETESVRLEIEDQIRTEDCFCDNCGCEWTIKSQIINLNITKEGVNQKGKKVK